MKDLLGLWRQWKGYREKLVDIERRVKDYSIFLDSLNSGQLDPSKVNKVREIEDDLQEVFEISRRYRDLTRHRPKKGAKLEQIENELNLPPNERGVDAAEVFNRLLQQDKAAIEEVMSIEGRLYSTKKGLGRRLIFKFDLAYSDLEKIAAGSDLELIKQKRGILDSAFLMYAALGIKQPRKIRGYAHSYELRPVIAYKLNRLEDTFRAGRWKQEDIRVLHNFINDVKSVSRRFNELRYYEGIAEAKKLQDEIYGRISELERAITTHPLVPLQQTDNSVRFVEQQTTIRTGPRPEQQTAYVEGGYFSVPIHLLSMAYPENAGYLRAYRILMGKEKQKDLVEKVSDVAVYISSLPPSGKPEDVDFIKSVEYGIRESVLRGDLTYRVKNPKEKEIVRCAVEKISSYLKQCEGLQIKILDTRYLLSQQALA